MLNKYPGVTLHRQKKGKNIYFAWRAAYRINGENYFKSFNIKKYGYFMAYRRAVKMRFSALKLKHPILIEPPLPDKNLKKWLIKNKINF